jgi:hypothetical protein
MGGSDPSWADAFAGLGVGDASAESAGGAPPLQPLGEEERRTLSKLVGCLTKEGKRSRAQRVLTDALQVISAQLRKASAASAAGATASASSASASSREKAN